VDPIADQFPWVSVFNYAENEPVGHIDLWGLQKVKKQESDGSFTLETVTVTAKRQGSNYDQSVDRYGFNGTFEQWQKTYGFEGMNYENASNYWNQAHSADFDANVVERDKAEAARIAVEKMTFWMGTVFPTVGGFAMSGLSPSLPSARGFNFTSPQAAKGVTKLPSNIHMGSQGKHIVGHNNFMKGKSILDANPQTLLDGVNAGKYSILRSNQNNVIVDFGENIGTFFQNGKAIGPTRYGTIHYGNKGAHIVPANPLQY